MEKLKIGIIVGSTREGRFSEHAAKWIKGLADVHENLETELVDLREYTLPFLQDAGSPSYMNGVYPEPEANRFAATIKKFDGFIIVTPEYNRSTSGVLKNALDHIFGEFGNKPVAFVAYGSVGGARAVEQLRLMAIEHEMAPIRHAVHIFAHWNLRGEDGAPKVGALDAYKDVGDKMLMQLTWWAKTLRSGREAIQS